MEGSTRDSNAESCSSQLIRSLNSPVTLGRTRSLDTQHNEMLTQFWTPAQPLPNTNMSLETPSHTRSWATTPPAALWPGHPAAALPLCDEVKSLPH